MGRDLDDALEQVAKALDAAAEVAVACHVNPDGDALGSLLGLALGLAKAGKHVAASWDGGPELPAGYAFLPGRHLLVDPGAIDAPEVLVAVDCGDAERLGRLAPAAARAGAVIDIDHHPGNPAFGHHNLVDPSAACTAELVVAVLDRLGIELDADIATCLYTGVMTDTGRFHHAATTPETLCLGARLRRYGVDATRIAQQVYESQPFRYLKLVGKMLQRATLVQPEGLIYSWIEQSDLSETGVALSDTESLIDVVRGVGEARVAAMLKQQPDGAYRVSLRSKGGVSVGEIARANGGGGHELAAGFSAPSVEDAVSRIRAALSS